VSALSSEFELAKRLPDQTYVRFMCALVQDRPYEVVEKVDSICRRTPDRLKNLEEVDRYAYAFYFFDRPVVMIGEEKFEGASKNASNWFYIGSRVVERAALPKSHATLRRNMAEHHQTHAVFTLTGEYLALDSKDVVLNKKFGQIWPIALEQTPQLTFDKK
jgi:hypothetical protein